MSYSLGGWDGLIPSSEPDPRTQKPQTYRLTVAAVRGLPSGSASEVPGRVMNALRAGFEYGTARWISGGRLQVQYRAARGTSAYGSGTARRRLVEEALRTAARSLGPSVRFVVGSSSYPRQASADPESPSDPSSDRAGVDSKWLFLGLGLAVVTVGGAMFVAGASAEGVRRERVRANRRRRR